MIYNMVKKLIYVTKKQVNQFIEFEKSRLKINDNQLLKEVQIVLTDLRQFPNDNLNQIKFYMRVENNLKSIL
tara:strand:- start:6523 stop:6738 length:216 start_codon:yes stop_codon:yes gene_type:complete